MTTKVSIWRRRRRTPLMDELGRAQDAEGRTSLHSVMSGSSHVPLVPPAPQPIRMEGRR